MSRRSQRQFRIPTNEPASRGFDRPTAPAAAQPGWRAWWRDCAPALRFLAVFGLLLGVFYVAILLPACDHAFYRYLCVNATVANALLRGLGQATTVAEVTIRSAQHAVSIRRGCNAIEPAWFFCAAVLAFPGHWKRKPAGLVVGVASLLALNLVRIVSLYFIGLHLPQFFPAAHLEVWPVVFILVALALWIAWIRWSQKDDRSPAHVAA